MSWSSSSFCQDESDANSVLVPLIPKGRTGISDLTLKHPLDFVFGCRGLQGWRSWSSVASSKIASLIKCRWWAICMIRWLWQIAILEVESNLELRWDLVVWNWNGCGRCGVKRIVSEHSSLAWTLANTTKLEFEFWAESSWLEAWMRISSGLPARTFSPTVALLFLLSLPTFTSSFNGFVDVDALIGLFLYYDENSATPKSFPSSPLSGISESWIERKNTNLWCVYWGWIWTWLRSMEAKLFMQQGCSSLTSRRLSWTRTAEWFIACVPMS